MGYQAYNHKTVLMISTQTLDPISAGNLYYIMCDIPTCGTTKDFLKKIIILG